MKNNSVKEERLPILVGNSEKVKLLGAAKWNKGDGADGNTGNLVATAALSLIEKFDCKKEIKALSFDTTKANTGHNTAANIKIQETLDCSLLWLACRHHVGEIIAGDVYKSLNIEIQKSPESTLFTKFKEKWDDFDKSCDLLSRFEIPEALSDEAITMIEHLKDEAIEVVKSVKDFVRDDYKDLAKLTLSYLCDPEQLLDDSTFHRPGGISHARWMSKLLCSLKLVMLEDDYEVRHVCSRKQSQSLRDFANFVALIYAPWWLTCSLKSSAPKNDLDLLKKLERYNIVNKTISNAGSKALKRHLWYLTTELAFIAIFDENVSTSEKHLMSEKLLQCKPAEVLKEPTSRHGFAYGAPDFPGKSYFI